MELILNDDFILKCILGLVGLVVSYFEKADNARQQGLKFTLKNQWRSLLLTVIVTFLAVFLRDDLKEIYPITNSSAVILGYAGSSFLLNFFKSKVPK